jgi:hypothetical protein
MWTLKNNIKEYAKSSARAIVRAAAQDIFSETQVRSRADVSLKIFASVPEALLI